jgi:hypothetical protein
MKRNRKAEALRDQRRLSRQEAERKQVAILLTEMEQAASQVLAEHFSFTEEQIAQFLELLRARYRDIQAQPPIFSQEKRLGVAAQKFGLAALQILIEAYGFTPELADAWLKKLIEQGHRNRAGEKK